MDGDSDAMKAMPRQTGRLQQGLTLIEVLITIVVLAIGLLGLAGLQTASLKNNQSSYYRSQAVMLTEDIFDRMRANRQAARTGNYNIAFGDAPPTGNNQAARDLSQWRNRITNQFPNGASSVAVNGATNVATVQVRWDDQRLESESSPTTITVQSRL